MFPTYRWLYVHINMTKGSNVFANCTEVGKTKTNERQNACGIVCVVWLMAWVSP